MSYYLRWHVTCIRSMILRLIKEQQKSKFYFNSMGNWDIQYTQGVSMNMYAKNIPKWNLRFFLSVSISYKKMWSWIAASIKITL